MGECVPTHVAFHSLKLDMTTKSPSECFTAQTILGFFGAAEVNPDVGGVAVAVSSTPNFIWLL